MSTNPNPQVVVVTGASGGVGRAVAHAFAKRGAHIGLLARGQRGLDDAADEVRAIGGQALAVPTDVADADQVEAAALAVEARFGPIDVWVNDAMATVFARFIDTEPAEFKRATEVTYLGAVYGTMAALRRMTQRDQGSVVQVGSALAYRAIPLQAAYCGAKFAIRGFTDSIRTELRADLPARDSRRGRLLGRPAPPPRGVGRLQHTAGHPWQQARPKLRRLVPRQDRDQRTAGPGHAPRRPAHRQPVRAGA